MEMHLEASIPCPYEKCDKTFKRKSNVRQHLQGKVVLFQSHNYDNEFGCTIHDK